VTEVAREKTDDEIRESILNYFRRAFGNFGGDYLDETVEGSEADYERACELMYGSELSISWWDE
jgi:hypothetical protein